MKTYYEQAVEAAEKMRQATPGSPARQGWRDEVVALSALAKAEPIPALVAHYGEGPEFTEAAPMWRTGDVQQHGAAPVEPLRRFDVERHPTAVLGAVGIFEPIDIRVLNDGRVEVRRPDDQGKDWTTIFDPDTLDLTSDIPDEEPLVEVPVAPAEVIEEAEADVEEFFGDDVHPTLTADDEVRSQTLKKGRKK